MSNDELVSQLHALDQDEQITTLEKMLGGLTLGTVVKLVPHLEEAWDVKATPQMGGVMPNVEAEAAEEEDQSEFDVVVTDIGAKKIGVIKAIRQLTQLNLKDAKAVLDKGVPTTVKEKLSKDEAENYKKQLEEAGATVELK